MTYHAIAIAGVRLFYREAGPNDAPVILLLHGFPSSSRMFETLMPLLADHYHLIAPDYPGFGASDAPEPAGFAYTFDHLAAVIGAFTEALGLKSYVLFMQDYGGPVGFRLALAHPERVRALIIQNAVAHEEGLGPLWETRRRYWADRASEEEALKANFTSYEATRQRHLGASPNIERYDPRCVERRIRLPHPPRPGADPGRSLLRLPDQSGLISALAGVASQRAAADAGCLGQI